MGVASGGDQGERENTEERGQGERLRCSKIRVCGEFLSSGTAETNQREKNDRSLLGWEGRLKVFQAHANPPLPSVPGWCRSPSLASALRTQDNGSRRARHSMEDCVPPTFNQRSAEQWLGRAKLSFGSQKTSARSLSRAPSTAARLLPATTWSHSLFSVSLSLASCFPLTLSPHRSRSQPPVPCLCVSLS